MQTYTYKYVCICVGMAVGKNMKLKNIDEKWKIILNHLYNTDNTKSCSGSPTTITTTKTNQCNNHQQQKQR